MTDTDPADGQLARVKALLERRWDALVVAALGVFMFLARMRPYDRYNGPNQSFFIGTDAYYHARHVLYTTANFPQLLSYDPWTQYPLGTDAGPFGTLFDQGAAALTWLVSLVSGTGTPTEQTILDVLTAYPALLGALTIVPVYVLTKDLFGRKGALFGAVGLALIPGSFLRRSIAGWPDHHSMEALLSSLALLGAYKAYTSWRAAEPSIDDVLGDPGNLLTEHRTAVAASMLGALGFFIYMAAWPPGLLFVGIAGLWLVVQILVDGARDRDPGPAAAASATLFTGTAILMLPHALTSSRGGFSAIEHTWMQPVVPLLLAVAALALGAIAREWDGRGLPRKAYPPAMVAAGLVGLGGLWLVLPNLVTQILSGASWVFDSTLGWLPGLGVERTRFTIAEAQPIEASELPRQFGFLFYTALGGLFLTAVDWWREGKPSDTLLGVWSFVTFSAAFTQSRFLYYLAVAVIALNAKFAKRLFDGAMAMSSKGEEAGKGRSSSDRISPRTGKVVVTVLLALALLPVNVLGFTASCREGEPNAWTQAGCFGPRPEGKHWTEATHWLRENTPQGSMSLTAKYDAPADGGRFDYPPGSYGVLSWWDYGHIIEWGAQRPPIANPFQQQAPLASEIFTARDEDTARSILQEYLGAENEARYLMIDDAMVAGKFSAITVWANERDTYQEGGSRTFTAPEGMQRDQVQLPTLGPEIRSMFLQHVYNTDANGYEHYRLVHELPTYAWIGNEIRETSRGLSVSQYNRVLGTGGPSDATRAFSSLSFESGDQLLPAGQGVFVYDLHVESVLKTFEHVPGATLSGSGPAGADVVVQIPLVVEGPDRAFDYTQRAKVGPDGTFEVTVPYATTGYVDAGAGGTNATVTAQGPARVTVGNQTASVDVPDRAVLEGNRVQVPLA